MWVSSWDVSLADDELARQQADRYTRLRSAISPHFEVARDLGQLPADADPEQLSAGAVAFVHGLVVQALFDPGRFPEDVQIAMLDDFLTAIARPRFASDGSRAAPDAFERP
ncbi:TetR family transcriptional regulator C-terminal domain-containing protein [Streptomyces sp. NPDC048560]|uniref:TetR family transcriptional regulator C-terminal domain-containing protein n=1 Tax=Streptomyces sp. NPDC048560 TaxID=3155488 RepID=UPI00341718E4